MKNTDIPHTTINSFLKEYKLAYLGLNFTEMKELFALVEEVKDQCFTYSSELSGYISKHKLGNKYRHISGVVTMENNGLRWNYDGGLPSKIYRAVCLILNLSNKKSNARMIKFESYASMY